MPLYDLAIAVEASAMALVSSRRCGKLQALKKIAINSKGNKDHLSRQDDYRKFNDAFNGKDMKKKTNPWDDPALEK